MVGMESEHAAVATVAAARPALRAWSRSRALSGLSAEVTDASVGPVAGLIAQMLLLAVLATTVRLSSAGWVVGVTSGVIIDAALFRGLSQSRTGRLNLAGWVTFVRATLTVGVAALVAESFDRHAPVTTLVSLAALALILDAIDGKVARRTRTVGTLGAQFDAEVDALLILVLSIYVARSAGAWVLAIGAARYAFLAAAWPLSWMRKPLPPRYWRKFVAATQGVVLTVAAADVLPATVNRGALVVALALLAESFIRDVWWLWAHRVTRSSGAAAVDAPTLRRRTPSAPPSARRGSVRTGVATALTIFAFAFVWAALVAPDRPSALTLTAFLRIPLEGLALVALVLVLPVRARRVLAGLLGLTLGLVVILKMLDVGFFMTFERPFDPIGDSGYASIGMETLSAAVGKTEAKLVAVGLVVATLVVLTGTTLSMLRLSAVAARNPRFSLRAVAALGAVWVICWLFGAQLVSRSPIASTSSAALIVREVHTVQADIHDKGVFAKEIKHDRFRYTPASKLLSALRGKDVILDFVESYGKVSVENSSFAPAIDGVLEQGTRQLQASGFSARTAFLTSSTFGGVSWLAHSTLQSGVWANSQLRYNQLVGTDRFTLSAAFKRAGWRTVADSPADDRVWADGKAFYHYDAIYDRGNVGYHGPSYTYATMPDQYLYLGLQRLELEKRKRPPIFAEVDSVSSHMPWNQIPQMIPWNQVGDGSIFKREPTEKNLDGGFWITPKRVRAAYAHSIEYSLNALVSYVQHYGRKNLVLIVVGDEQPLPIVSGEGASHDVPISIIAHDPKVLDQINSWGWRAGLRPSPRAPVWPMSAFRDRFLTAYGSTPGP
jgi:phosphatidylglycerophosphate synthase